MSALSNVIIEPMCSSLLLAVTIVTMLQIKQAFDRSPLIFRFRSNRSSVVRLRLSPLRSTENSNSLFTCLLPAPFLAGYLKDEQKL